jgi:hypothetical protein
MLLAVVRISLCAYFRGRRGYKTTLLQDFFIAGPRAPCEKVIFGAQHLQSCQIVSGGSRSKTVIEFACDP